MFLVKTQKESADHFLMIYSFKNELLPDYTSILT